MISIMQNLKSMSKNPHALKTRLTASLLNENIIQEKQLSNDVDNIK